MHPCRLAMHFCQPNSDQFDQNTPTNDEEGYGEKRICMECRNRDSDKKELNYMEDWRGQAKTDKRIKRSKYLAPAPEWAFAEKNSDISKKKTAVLPLKNGANISQLLTMLEGKMSLNDTSAFDVVVQSIAVAIVDSPTYYDYVAECSNQSSLLRLAMMVVKK